MTQQSDFFSLHQPSTQEPVIVVSESTTRKPKQRVFVYDGQDFEDPGPQYSIEDVLRFLAQTYPELEDGAWNSRLMPDETEEITFVKVTGEKGGEVTAHLIARRLTAGVQPSRIQATNLLNQLIAAEAEGALTVPYLLEAEPQIEAALHQAEQVAQASQRILARCLALKAVPLPQVPLGF
jgi:PRTRC genetic system protein C